MTLPYALQSLTVVITLEVFVKVFKGAISLVTADIETIL